MSRVVLIPGAFNPPTKAHMEIGNKMREQFPDADIIYVPCSLEYLKRCKNVKTINYNRFEVLVSLLFDQRGFYVSDVEIDSIVSGKTWETIKYYKTIERYDEVHLVLGEDNIKALNTWENVDYIKSNSTIITIPRNESLDTISSTRVRQAYSCWNWDLVRRMCPDFVYRWMYLNRDNDLFGEGEKYV